MAENDNVIHLDAYRDSGGWNDSRISHEKQFTDMELVAKYGETAIAATQALMYFAAHGAPAVRDTANMLIDKVIEVTQDQPPSTPPV